MEKSNRKEEKLMERMLQMFQLYASNKTDGTQQTSNEREKQREVNIDTKTETQTESESETEIHPAEHEDPAPPPAPNKNKDQHQKTGANLPNKDPPSEGIL